MNTALGQASTLWAKYGSEGRRHLGLSQQTEVLIGWPLTVLCEEDSSGISYSFTISKMDDEAKQKLVDQLDELGLQIEWHLLDGDMLSVNVPEAEEDQQAVLQIFTGLDLSPGQTDESALHLATSLTLLEMYKQDKDPTYKSAIINATMVTEDLGYTREEMVVFYPSATEEIIDMLMGSTL